jgi:hypothetical protein
MGDLAALTAKDQRTGEIASRIARMVVAFCRADYQLTWSWKDPLPTLFLYASFARSNFSKLLRKFRALWKGSAGRGPVAPWQNG